MSLHAHFGEAADVYPRLLPGSSLIVSDGAGADDRSGGWA